MTIPGRKISQFPDGGALEDTDQIVVARAGGNFAISGANFPIKPSAPVVITSTTNFVKASYPGLYAIKVKLQAPGGGGGGVAGASSQVACANSGGGGEYAEKFILASALGDTETVTIGAVGTGGAAGNNNGGSGGNCSFGSHFNVVGGGGGNGEAASATVPRNGAVGGGAGGTGGTGGDLHIPGGASIPGMCWTVNATQASVGGASFLGSNTRSTSVIGADEAGIVGKNWGSGGTGARSSNDANNRAGGNGAPGRCEIELYIK